MIKELEECYVFLTFLSFFMEKVCRLKKNVYLCKRNKNNV